MAAKLTPPWTPEEEAVLRQRYADTDTRQLAADLGRTYLAVKNRAITLKLTKSAACRSATARDRAQRNGFGSTIRAKRPRPAAWSHAQDAYLLKHARPPYSYSHRQLGEDVGRAPEAVRARLKSLVKSALRNRGGSLPAPCPHDKRWLLDAVIAHVTSRDSIAKADLANVISRLSALRGQPPGYWHRWANRPVQEFLAEVGAA